ncbi:MAG: hypothetical protein JST59_02120 [Actinobacteria bacterium]|nr:hypothetical protein [Actinomycetota bacterium]
MERGLPLNEVIAARLMTGLTINFRFWAKKSTNEIQLISPENEKGDVVEEHLLVLFVQVLRSTIDRHIKLLNVAKEPECMIVLLDTSLEMVRNKQKELLLAVLELVLTLVKSLLSERAEFVEKIFPSTLSTLFNLVLNQQAETKSVKAKQLALKVVTELLYAHFQKKPHLPTKLILSLPGEKHSNDSTLDHITRYLDTLTRNIETLGLQEKYQEIEELVRRVLLSPGSHTSGLLPYIYRLAYTVDVSPDLSLESEYNRSVVSESLRDELRLQIGLLSSRSKNLMNS